MADKGGLPRHRGLRRACFDRWSERAAPVLDWIAPSAVRAELRRAGVRRSTTDVPSPSGLTPSWPPPRTWPG
ncbi:hypothetical protein HBB16_05715 [Pseudonocardia sp. MCCB 268]|nr:hypothetical protein [Pseudonocardia cytotoxica]